MPEGPWHHIDTLTGPGRCGDALDPIVQDRLNTGYDIESQYLDEMAEEIAERREARTVLCTPYEVLPQVLPPPPDSALGVTVSQR